MLAVLSCALAVSQSTRPLFSLTLSSTPTLAIHPQKLAPYTVEEVGNEQIDPSISSFMTISLVVAEPEPKFATTSKTNEVDVTEWPSKCLFHRRTPRPHLTTATSLDK